MAKLIDAQIKPWIKAGERFEGRSDGNGLYLRYRAGDKAPVWRFRYQFAGKSRVMLVGSYSEISLSKAREIARGLSARIALGFDVAGEKKARKAAAIEKMERERNALCVSGLATEYFERQISGRWKHPDLLRRRIDKDINPYIGSMKIEDVKPRHVDAILQSVVDRGAPTVASDALHWAKRIFDYAIRHRALELNPTGALDLSDADGQENSHMCWLTREELICFFQAIRTAKGFSHENGLTMKLILRLCCRKVGLCGTQWDEFDLGEAVWHLPAEHVKNGDAIDIPLPPPAVGWLRELHTIAGSGSKWVLPARKIQHHMIPHIQESTLPVAPAKVRREIPEVPDFTIHDFRRIVYTHLVALGVDPVVAERYPNHHIKGVESIYNRHQCFEERRVALELWVELLVSLERGEDYNVIPLSKIQKFYLRVFTLFTFLINLMILNNKKGRILAVKLITLVSTCSPSKAAVAAPLT